MPCASTGGTGALARHSPPCGQRLREREHTTVAEHDLRQTAGQKAKRLAGEPVFHVKGGQPLRLDLPPAIHQ
jgi:hypothetical protein